MDTSVEVTRERLDKLIDFLRTNESQVHEMDDEGRPLPSADDFWREEYSHRVNLEKARADRLELRLQSELATSAKYASERDEAKRSLAEVMLTAKAAEGRSVIELQQEIEHLRAVISKRDDVNNSLMQTHDAIRSARAEALESLEAEYTQRLSAKEDEVDFLNVCRQDLQAEKYSLQEKVDALRSELLLVRVEEGNLRVKLEESEKEREALAVLAAETDGPRNAIKALTYQVEDLQQELRLARTHAEIDLNAAVKARDEAKEELVIFKDRSELLMDRYQRAERAEIVLKNTLDGFRTDLEGWRAKETEWLNHRERMQGELDAKTWDNAKLAAAVEEASLAAKATKEKMAVMEDTIDIESRGRATAEAELKRTTADLAAAKSTVATLEEKTAALTAQLEEAHLNEFNLNAAVEREKNEHAADVAAHYAKEQAKEAEVLAQQDIILGLRDRIRELEQEVAFQKTHLAERTKELQAANDAVAADLVMARTEIQRLGAKIENQTAFRAAYETTTKELNEKARAAVKEVEQRDAAIKVEKDKVEALNGRIKNDAEKIARLDAQIKDMDDRMRATRSIETQLEAARTNNASLTDRLTELKASQTALKTDVRETKAAMKAQEDEMEALRKRDGELTAQITKLQTDNSTLTDQLGSAKQQAEAGASAVVELEQLKGKYAALQGSLGTTGGEASTATSTTSS